MPPMLFCVCVPAGLLAVVDLGPGVAWRVMSAHVTFPMPCRRRLCPAQPKNTGEDMGGLPWHCSASKACPAAGVYVDVHARMSPPFGFGPGWVHMAAMA